MFINIKRNVYKYKTYCLLLINMELSRVFAKKSIDIIELLNEKPRHIRDVAEELGCNPATVHAAASLFEKIGIVKTTKRKNMKLISLNRENAFLRGVKSLINLYKLKNSKTYPKLAALGQIGIYGSYAQGSDDPTSDIDMWIHSQETNLRQVLPLIKELEQELKKTVNVLILTDRLIKRYIKEDPEFYIRLKLTSKFLDGDIFVL